MARGRWPLPRNLRRDINLLKMIKVCGKDVKIHGPAQECVRALHNAGIEVILDVVFNHTVEGPPLR